MAVVNFIAFVSVPLPGHCPGPLLVPCGDPRLRRAQSTFGGLRTWAFLLMASSKVPATRYKGASHHGQRADDNCRRLTGGWFEYDEGVIVRECVEARHHDKREYVPATDVDHPAHRQCQRDRSRPR